MLRDWGNCFVTSRFRFIDRGPVPYIYLFHVYWAEEYGSLYLGSLNRGSTVFFRHRREFLISIVFVLSNLRVSSLTSVFTFPPFLPSSCVLSFPPFQLGSVPHFFSLALLFTSSFCVTFVARILILARDPFLTCLHLRPSSSIFD